jgi:hypothetical protein
MPWQIVKSGKKYFVETISTKRKHSKEGLSLAMAKKQLAALEINAT